jgi:hypothetical protein
MSRPQYDGKDTVKGEIAGIQNASVHDFWNWAFSDLCDDDLKGFFAEWLVAKLLGISSTRRVSWANSDIITPEGVRIEVKASSYWQSWKLLDEFGNAYSSPLHPISAKTRIGFAGLKARDAVTVPGPKTKPEFKSHVYVFAFQHEEDSERWDALDLTQWEFYVVSTKKLKELGWKSISLKMLRSLQSPLNSSAFVEAAKLAINEAAAEIRSRADHLEASPEG